MKILAVTNQKGGVGKTTSSVNIAHCLSVLGHPTLLIDTDPQANATSSLGIEAKKAGSLYSVLTENVPIEEKIIETGMDNFFLIPSEMDLAGAEIEIAQQPDHLNRIRNILHSYRERSPYRYCIIDCPPSLGILMTNVLTATDQVIIPIQCEYFALEGLSRIIHLIERIKESTSNETLEIAGILMTMFDIRTRLSQQVVENVRQHLGQSVFRSVIPRSTRIAESPSHGKPLLTYDPEGVGALAYQAVTQELLNRLEGDKK